MATPPPEALSLFREQLPSVVAGTFFIWAGLVAFGIAAIRRKAGAKLLLWLGTWTGMFGIQELLKSPLIFTLLPRGIQPIARLIVVSCFYLVLVAAGLTFLQLTKGIFRNILRIKVIADFVVAIFGIAAFVFFGSQDAFLVHNAWLAASGLVFLTVVAVVPSLSHNYLVLGEHRVLTAGLLVFAAQALHVNLSHTFNFYSPGVLSYVGFATLLLALGYTSLEMIVENEHRLLSIDNELALARQLQFSILPAEIPTVNKIRIGAKYLPMTAVAGDFYHFLPLDDHHVGFLVADVSGHGVPAALIASMIKTATHSVNGCADQPSEVLRRIGGILHGDLRGQFVSAAYFYIDTEKHTATYAAAGHPPLLHWRASNGKLERIESNGLLFGVKDDFEIPQCTLDLNEGDRVLLYTDGVTEPENGAGEAFGESRLEQVLRDHDSCPAQELTEQLVADIQAWTPKSSHQQDDITLIVIDVL